MQAGRGVDGRESEMDLGDGRGGVTVEKREKERSEGW